MALAVLSALALTPGLASASAPPFTQCPAIGQDTGCEILVVVEPSGSITSFNDPTQPPFDASEDTLIGVQNNSTSLFPSLRLTGGAEELGIFEFDGDGLCTVEPPLQGCPFGETGYEGPNTSFTVTNGHEGTVNFLPSGIAHGGSAYFSLEEPIRIECSGGSCHAQRESGIELAPPAHEAQVGSASSLTATVIEEGKPRAEQLVTFTVAGANPQTSQSATNEAGQTTFTYTGANPGTDRIVASFVDKSGSTIVSSPATNTWIAPPAPRVELPQPGAISTKVGSPFGITARVTEGGVPQAGVPVTFKVTGVNPQTASIPSNSAGQSTFSYQGVNTGIDHIVASFVDRAGQSVISNEVTETWAAAGIIPFKISMLAAPVLGKTVNVEPVSGKVFIKLPPGATLSRAGSLSGLSAPEPLASESLGKGIGFVPLTEARHIPVGSTLDTTEGVVLLETAAAAAGKQQFGEFSAGIFTILQARKQKGLANLTIVNTLRKTVCATAGKKAQAAAKRLSHRVLGLLKGSAHGKYTTNGQYSAATVRGTIWSVANRCDGTLTAVTRGVVSVRDFVRRKTITVRAGQHYLAKAP
jgi:hypothetical protein